MEEQRKYARLLPKFDQRIQIRLIHQYQVRRGICAVEAFVCAVCSLGEGGVKRAKGMECAGEGVVFINSQMAEGGIVVCYMYPQMVERGYVSFDIRHPSKRSRRRPSAENLIRLPSSLPHSPIECLEFGAPSHQWEARLTLMKVRRSLRSRLKALPCLCRVSQH